LTAFFQVLATYPTDGEAVLQDLEVGCTRRACKRGLQEAASLHEEACWSFPCSQAPRGTSAKPLLYAKHIAKHKLACSVRVFRGPGSHILLVREPKRVVASFAKVGRTACRLG
jgi:hypothetical protein